MDPGLYKSITRDSSLREFQPDVFLKQVTVSNNSALHVASQSGVYKSALVICTNCPSLRRHQNTKGDTPLHIAAREGRKLITELLLQSQHEYDPERGGLGGVGALLRMTNKKMDTALHMAVRNNHFEVVRLLTGADPELEYFANEAGETPLYLAVEDGRYEMVQHILETCQAPSHGGPDGRTTLQAAILRDQSDMASLLMNKAQDLIKQVDNKGWTPLHCAARVGNIMVIKYITDCFPDIWEAVDENGCNFLHLAAWYNQIDVVKYVLGNREMNHFVLNSQTTKGNTSLHLAAHMLNKDIVVLLVSDKRVNLITMNDENLTALEQTDKKALVSAMKKAGVIKSRRKEIVEAQYAKPRKDGWDASYLRVWKERVSTELVVNALIATVSFTAGLTVPGGFITDGRYEGTAMLSRKSVFQVFIISNAMAMWLSVYAILNYSWARTEPNADKIFRLVRTASICTYLALLAMIVAFATGSYAVLSSVLWLVITICIMGCSVFCFSCMTFSMS